MGDEGAAFDLPVVACGYVRQAGTVAFQRGCTIAKAGTGVWTLTMLNQIPAEMFVAQGTAITGFSPGVTVSISWTNITTMTLFTYDSHGNTGIDIDCTFQIRRLLPGA